MTEIDLEYGEAVSIPFTIDSALTGKLVVFAVSKSPRPDAARVLLKTSDDDITITKFTAAANDPAAGTIDILVGDFAVGKLQIGLYYYSLWFQTPGDDTTRVHVAKGTMPVGWTITPEV